MMTSRTTAMRRSRGIELAQIGVAAATESYACSARATPRCTTILDLLESQGALTEAEATLVPSRYATRLAWHRSRLLGRRLSEKRGER